MAKDVNFTIKLNIDGKEQIVTASTNVQALAKQLGIAKDKSTQLKDSLLTFVQANLAFEKFGDSISLMTGAMSELIAANTANVEAETKLANSMRNTMGALDSDIESVKSLCAAQQELGVISQGVQIAGAQQLASFLQQRESLEKLIPVMNDMAVQQYGLNVSQEGAASVAKTLGKAMSGNITSLTRLGYTFTDAQEEILKFGTEEERAATLAEVVEAKVGGMNAEMAKTDAGKAQQYANTIDDIKARFGAMVAPMEKIITAAGGVSKGFASLGQTATGIISVSKAVKSLASVTASAATAIKNFVVQASAARLAITGLLAATGAGVAIAALSDIISKLSSEAGKGKAALDDLKAGEDAYVQASANAQVEIQNEIKHLGNLKDGTADAASAVAHLNETYGTILGTYQSVSEWMGVLTEKQADYIKLMGLEAQKREILSQLAEKEAKKAIEEQKLQGLRDSGRDKTTKTSPGTEYLMPRVEVVETKEAREANKNIKEYSESIDALNESMGTVDAAIEKVKKGIGSTSGELKVSEMNWQQVSDAIRDTENKLKNTTDEGEIKRLKEYNAQLKAHKEILESTLGFSSQKAAAPAPAKPEENTDEAMPESLNTLQDYNKALEILRKEQLTCNQEEYRALQEQIDKINEERDVFMGLTKEEASEEWKPAAIDKLNTLGELSDALSYYQKLQQSQSLEEAQNTQKTINIIKQKAEAMQSALDLPAIEEQTKELQSLSVGDLKMQLQLIGVDSVRQTLLQLQTLMKTAPDDQRTELAALVDQWKQYSSVVGLSRDSGNAAAEGLNAIGGTMSSLSGMMNDETQQWMQWGATVLQAVASAIPAIMSLVSAKKAEANANAESAVTGAASSVASTPVVGWIMAGAAIASVVAALATIPKFALGGIVGGPTYALVGEYAEAQTNPEVIAPLDRLRSLIEPSALNGGKVEFEIKGRRLVGILGKESNRISRS